MNFQQDVAYVEKNSPWLKVAAKVLAIGILAITVWKGVHGFATVGIIAGVVLLAVSEKL